MSKQSKALGEDSDGKEHIPLPTYDDMVQPNPGVKKSDWKGAVIKDR